MKVIIRTDTNEAYTGCYDSELNKFQHDIQVPTYDFWIDEEEHGNQELCRDLIRTFGKINNSGQRKYVVTGESIDPRPGWQEMFLI